MAAGRVTWASRRFPDDGIDVFLLAVIGFIATGANTEDGLPGRFVPRPYDGSIAGPVHSFDLRPRARYRRQTASRFFLGDVGDRRVVEFDEDRIILEVRSS